MERERKRSDEWFGVTQEIGTERKQNPASYSRSRLKKSNRKKEKSNKWLGVVCDE